jgi:hypothetical protein
MIRAERLTVKAVMEALRRGCYYSSCGPQIQDFRVCNRKISLKCSPVSEVHFVAQTFHGFSFYAKGDELITSAEFDCSDYSNSRDLMTKDEFDVYSKMKYIRAEVIDPKGKHAWTNPVFFE